jgi:AraC-like DNA-binding protein
VVAYILKRRTELARHLLCEAKMPPRAVAAMIGAKDLQTFNKLLRRGSGFSPRGIREKS